MGGRATAYDALELAAWPRARRPARSSPGTSPPTDSTTPRRERVRRRARRERAGALGARLLRQQPPSGPGPARGDPRPRPPLHRRRPQRSEASPSAPSSAATTRSASPRTSARPSACFPPLVEYAGERGVRLMVENCVMEGWHPDGYPGNLAYSPELWEWMFELGFWLNFDPSHLLWIGIDPVEALAPYVDRVIHAHAKDAETFPEERNRFGFFGRLETRESDPWDMGWWRFRVPGPRPGRLPRLRADALVRAASTGVLSVEHEDPVWSGSDREDRRRARDRASQSCDRWWTADGVLGEAPVAGPRGQGPGQGVPRRQGASRGRASRSRRARSTACSGPTAPASRR